MVSRSDLDKRKITQATVQNLISLAEKATAGQLQLETRYTYSADSDREPVRQVLYNLGSINSAKRALIAAIEELFREQDDLRAALAEAMDAISYIKRERLGDDLPDCAERLLRAWNAKEVTNAG